MILPFCLNNAVIAENNVYFTPVDTVDFNITQEEIITSEENITLDFNISSDVIEVDVIQQEIIIEEMEEDVETVQNCKS
jgi:hypothetical protein